MESFMSALSQNERQNYQRLSLIASLNNSIFTPKYDSASKSSKIPSSLTSQDLINVCKYSNPLIAPIHPVIRQKINNQKFGMYCFLQSFRQQNFCLHIAAQFGNIHMVKHLVRGFNKLEENNLQPDQRKSTSIQGSKKDFNQGKQIDKKNKNLDTALMHCLRNNSENKMQKITTYLASTQFHKEEYSDLTLRDKQNRLCFQISLPSYNVSKVRILEFLKEKYQSSV